MLSQKQLEALSRVWQRVEASRPKFEGSARLMPRKKKRPVIRIPPQGISEN